MDSTNSRQIRLYNSRHAYRHSTPHCHKVVVTDVAVPWWNGAVWAYRRARQSGCPEAYARSLIWTTLAAVTEATK